VFLGVGRAIGLLYGAGLNWGQHTHLSMGSTGGGGVHLWVEASSNIRDHRDRLLFARLQLDPAGSGGQASLLSAGIYLPAALSHLPPSLFLRDATWRWPGLGVQRARGGSADDGAFSPSTISGAARLTTWTCGTSGRITSSSAVASGNMVGAGLLFHDQPADRLYYMQGLEYELRFTACRAVGVYGMLGMA